MMLKFMWQTYVHQLKIANPIKTNIATAGFLYGLGDLTCQMAIERK